MLGLGMESSIRGVVQVNRYLPEGGKVENLDGTQQRAVKPVLGIAVVVGVGLETDKNRPSSLSRTR